MKKNEWIAVIVVMFVVAIAVSFLTINLITGGVIKVAESKKGTELYSKAEVDAKLANMYTKIEVDKKINSGGGVTTTTSNTNSYSKAEVDAKLADIYNKTQVDSRLNNLYSSQAEISGIKLLAGKIYAAYPYNLQLGKEDTFGRVTIMGELFTKPIASSGQELFYTCSDADGQIFQSSSACR